MASLAMENTSDTVYPRCIKVNWTIHGGGSDNYYFRKSKMPPPENKELIKMYNDFVKVKDLYEHINQELVKVHGKEGRKIKSLKIFRWTSPGASIVSNEEVDDVFRGIFQHPYWHQLYENPAWRTREALGKGVPQLSETVGAEVEYERGPGELMNDLQLFSYVEGEDDGDVFLNELLSTEYASKYTQSTSSDFGLWFCQHDDDNDLPTFERELPWVYEWKKANEGAKNMHDTIFKVGQGEAGVADDIKMTEAITNIIIECSKHMTADEWVDNWEFYPITCSPMQGVEGRPTLEKVNKPMKYDETLQLPKYQRLQTNPGLWFMYLLNIARRCLVFKKGKEKRKQYVDGGPKWADTKDSVQSIDAKKHKFDNGYDCLDPDERRQLYIDINGFCQNIRPGLNRQGTNLFNKVTIDGEEHVYDLFDDAAFSNFLTKCTDGNGVKLDAREDFICRIEKDLGDIEGGPLSEIFKIVDQKVLELQPPLSGPDKFIKVPYLYKLLFFVIYNASNVEDGIAKEYAFGHRYYQFSGSAEKEKAGKQEKNTTMTVRRKDRGWGLLGWLPGYDFGGALGSFVKSVSTGWAYPIQEDPNAQKMASGVNTQLVSTFRNKCPFTEGQQEELGFTEWQDGERAYEYFKLAVPYERSLEEEIEEQMILFAPSLVGDDPEKTTEVELKEKLRVGIKEQLVYLPCSKELGKSNYKELFEKIYKKLISNKTITFDGKSYTKTKQGGKKKRRRKKRTRKKRKIKFKWTRKRKKRRKKKIIRIKIKNKTTRNYIKVKKLAKKKRKKRTRKRRRR